MAAKITEREKVETIAQGLRSLGWTPAISMVSTVDKTLPVYSIGVMVKIGDDRLQWEKTARNPLIDFFSIANIANGVSTSMARAPIGFDWSIAGTDSVLISPGPRESLAKFVGRLTKVWPGAAAAKEIARQRANKQESPAAEKGTVEPIATSLAQNTQMSLPIVGAIASPNPNWVAPSANAAKPEKEAPLSGSGGSAGYASQISFDFFMDQPSPAASPARMRM